MKPKSVVMVAFVLWSCGDDGPPLGPEVADPGQANKLCQKYCAFNGDACYDPEDELTSDEVASCMDACLYASTWWRGDLLECLSLLDCDGDETRACVDPIEPADVLADYEEACTRRNTECFPDHPDLPDIIWCECDPETSGNRMSLVAPEIVEAMIACLEGPCDQIGGCYDELFPRGAYELFLCAGS